MPTLPAKTQKVLLASIDTEFKQINSSFPTINYGGCGLFAEHSYEVLKSLGFTPKLAILSYSNANTIKYGIDNNLAGKMVPFSHIIVTVGRKYIDSTGVYTDVKKMTKRNMTCVKGLPLSLLKEWNRQKNTWNDEFDRKTSMPRIKRRLKEIQKTLINQI